MSIDSPKGMVRQFDDFLGDTLNGDLYVVTVDTSGTVAVTDVEIDGTVQLDTDTTSGDVAFFATNLNWRIQDGALRMEARVKTSVITTIALNIGFSDATTESSTIPTTNASDVFTAVATDWIGFSFDVNASTDVITCAWTDDGAVSTEPIANRQFTGLAPVADTYYTYILELQDKGSGNTAYATFSVIDNNGKMYTKEFANTIDRDVPLCAVIAHDNTGAAAHETTIDYLEVTKSRATGID